MRKLTSATFSVLLATAAGCAAPGIDADSDSRTFEHRLRRTIVTSDAQDALTITERMSHYKVPAVSVAVIEGCTVVLARAYGVTTPGGLAVGPDTLFQAASISKPVTALAALRLVEQGKLALDSDVRMQLTSWQLPDSPLLESEAVTLRRLLSHSAGLGVSGYGGYRTGQPLPTVPQILDGLPPATPKPVRVESVPGTQWKYSGGGYTLLQLLMSDVMQRPFARLMQEQALAPLGMTNSTFEQPLPERLAVRAARAHGFDGAPIDGRWHVYPELAAAGLWSTPRDLAQVAIAVMYSERGARDSILSQPMAAAMLTPQIAQRGLGWIVQGEGTARSFSHGGTNEGYRAWLLAYPETCQGAVVMTNGDNGRLLLNEILRALADTHRWPDAMPSAQRQRIAMTPQIRERFIGTWRSQSAPDEPFRIALDASGELVMKWSGRNDELLHASPDGLFGPDMGIVITAKDSGDTAKSLSYTYALPGAGTFQATRLEP